MPSGTDVRIRIWCANVSDATHTGIQKSKDGAVTAPVAVAGGGGAGGGAGAGGGGGGTTYECVVNVRGDEIDRVGVPRFRGGFVNGSKVHSSFSLFVHSYSPCATCLTRGKRCNRMLASFTSRTAEGAPKSC